MQNGASVLGTFGVGLSDTIGLMTAGVEVLGNGNKVGNGLKSIAIRLAGIKASAKDGSLSLNKTAKALGEVAGVNVFSNEKKGELKNMTEILDEVKSKWSSFTEEQRAGLSEAIAGKQQASVFNAIMTNYDAYKKMQGEFSHGEHFGSMEQENAKFVDSVAGKLNELKEIWISIGSTVVTSDFLKGALDGAIGFSQGLEKIITLLDKTKQFAPVIASIGLTFSKVAKDMSLQRQIQIASGQPPTPRTNLFSNMRTDINNATQGMRGFTRATTTSKTAVRTMGSNIRTMSTSAVTSIKSVGASLLTSFASMAVVNGIILGVSYAYKKATRGVADEAERLREVESSQQATIDALEDKKSVMETVGAEYEKLKGKADRTAEEEARMLELGNELAKIMPEIKIGTDEEGNAIISMTDNMDGYIDKTKEAIEQQNRLMLGTKLEQSDNALKMLTKGEFFGKGLNDQKIDIQTEYDSEMIALQNKYNTAMYNARNSDGENQREHLLKARQVREDMIKAESKYGNEFANVQSQIMEQAGIFRDTMHGTWRDSASLLIEDLTPELESSIERFTNAMDFSEISSETELDGIKSMFRELPKLAQDGTIDMELLNSQLSDINKEFANTHNLEDYNTNIGMLAKSISADTGWDVDLVKEMFTAINDGALKTKDGLEDFLQAFGTTKYEIDKDGGFAKALQSQFVAINDELDAINNNDFGSAIATANLRIELQTNQDLPSEVRGLVNKLTNVGLDDDVIVNVTGEVLMALKDGKIDENELIILEQEIDQELRTKLGKKYDADMQADVHAYLESLNTEELTKEIQGKIDGSTPVNKEVNIDGNAKEKAQEINNSIEIIEKRPDVYKKVNAVIDGEDDLILFAEIIKNLPIDKEHTNKFIVDNADALSKMGSYKEVLEWIQKQDDEFKTKYKLTTEGVDKGIENVEKLNEVTKDSEKDKVFQIKTNNDEILESIDDIETLVKYSAEIEEGKFKLDIDANTQDAVENLGNLETKLKDVSDVMKESPTMKFRAETALASKNITGLLKNVDRAKKASSVIRTVRFRAETALASKNITGLIKKIQTCASLSKPIRTARFRSETALASQNITGLIKKINSVPTGTKTIKYKVITVYSTSGSPTSASSGAKFGGVSIGEAEIVTAPTSPTPQVATPQVATPQVASASASISSTPGATPTSSPTPQFTASATQNTNVAIGGASISNSMKYDVNLLKELENRIKSVGNALSLLDKKMESAVGSKKIGYLKQQNKLYAEQVSLQKNLEDKLVRQKNYYKYFLTNKGFQFNSDDGNFKNYEEKLILMEKEKKRLDDIAKSKSDASSDYNGKNKSTKNRLKAQADASKKASDEYNKSLQLTKKYLKEYTQVAFTDLPKVKQEYEDIANTIRENNEEIREVNRTQRLFADTVRLKALNNEYDKISDNLELINAGMEGAYGKDRLRLIDKQVEAYRKQQKTQKEMIKSMQHEMKVYQNDLDDFGFKFDASGEITNFEAIMKKYANSGSIEEITKLTDEYFKIYRDELPDAKKGIVDLEKAINDSAKEQLRVTKDMQDKIIEMKRQEVEEKKKLIDEELEKKTDALEKEKDAYNKMRREMDYKDDLQEQKDAVAELEKDISIAERDTSLSGQARLKDLMDKLKEEQGKLQDMVQANLDEQINNSIDEESKRLTEKAEQEKERLDNEYTDENLRKMADNALKTGMYTDINGMITDLQDSMLTFENQFGDGLSAIGGLVKSELVANLEIAKDSMRDMNSLIKELNLSQFSGFTITDTSKLSGKYGASTQNAFNFNQPLLTVQGNVTADIMPRVEKMIRTAKDEITRDIVKTIK